MNMFQKSANALSRLLYGRNGVDQLNRALLWIVLALSAGGSLMQRHTPFAGMILQGAGLLGWAFWIFRTFSKNLPRRRAENEAWMRFFSRVKSRRAGAKARRADKAHKYFTCKTCKTVCRVPMGKGKIIITCPKCSAQIHAKS